MMIKEQTLTIQQVAEATGLSVFTLRYYERIGLIHPIDRAENTHRRYTDDDVGWIDFLMKLRATGMSIQEMQVYAEHQRQGDITLPERVEMLKALRVRVEKNLAELHQNLELVCWKIDVYEEIIAESQEKSS